MQRKSSENISNWWSFFLTDLKLRVTISPHDNLSNTLIYTGMLKINDAVILCTTSDILHHSALIGMLNPNTNYYCIIFKFNVLVIIIGDLTWR